MSQIPKDDLVGFLTGIPTRQKPDPYTGRGAGLMNIAREQGTQLADLGRKMRGVENPEARQARALAAIDFKSPEGLQRLAQAQKATGDVAGSLATTGKLQELQKTQARKEALLKVARAQGNELIEDFIMQAGDTESALTKAQEVLFRKKPEVKPTQGEKPTATDITAAKKALSLAGEEAKGGEAFGFLGTDWNDAWNNQTEAAKDLLATQVAEVTNKLIKPPASLDLSEARKLAIQKMYTDNLTETGLFEWDKGESRMMTPDEIEEKQKQDLEARLKKPEYQ